MMVRQFTALMVGSIFVLGACSPRVPDSAAGVGEATSPFNAPPAVSQGSALPQGIAIAEERSSPAASGTAAGGQSNDDIARETAAALSAVSANSGQEPLQASPANPAPALVGNAAISDENDFEAVAERQTIESDAQRLARQRAQYQQVTPTAVPDRPADSGPNIVSYALSTSNPVGQRVHSRTGINLQARSQRNCAEYASPELAQIAFLEMGGPRRDRRALDPDGDGYACGWDPRPYRAAVRGQ